MRNGGIYVDSVMNDKDKETLRRCRVPLSRDLKICEIWDALVQVGLFEPTELEILERNDAPMTRLMDAIEKKGPHALQQFKDALKLLPCKPHLLELLDSVKENKFEKNLPVDSSEFKVKKEPMDEPDAESLPISDMAIISNLMETITELLNKLEKRDIELEEERAFKENFQKVVEDLKIEVDVLMQNRSHLTNQNFRLTQCVNVLTDMQFFTQRNDSAIYRNFIEKIQYQTAQLNNFRNLHTQLFKDNVILMSENKNLMKENSTLKNKAKNRKRVSENSNESCCSQCKRNYILD
ncbi:uncharacterized protein [Antedon mediterranea]|uniref:uncharacterized protein n=1 Tax=Antedon mediterranea TaxID=105859 RepID=UPI003AF69028